MSRAALLSNSVAASAQFLEHLVPAVLLKDEVALALDFWRDAAVARDFLLRPAEFLERLVDVVLVDHDARLGAAGFGAEFGAEPVEVEFAVLEVGIGLYLVPGEIVSLG